MKYFLIAFFFTGLYAWAELPNSISDKKTDDNFTYVDSKANSALQVTKNFTSAKSTVTVSGWIDIGWERVVNDCGSASSCQSSCSSGKKLTGGGCSHAANVFSQSGPVDDDTWGCAISNTQALTATAICARVK